MYCWNLAWRILSITLLSWDECNFAVVWTLFNIAFLWDWNENWPFPVLWPLLSFPNLLAYWVQHFHSIIFQDWRELNWNSIISSNFVVMFLMAPWLRIPGSLALGEWSQHCGYLGHQDLFCFPVYPCHIFLISYASVRSIPFLSFIEPIFAWNVPLDL